MSWLGNDGNLWLFGGVGIDSTQALSNSIFSQYKFRLIVISNSG